MMRIISVVVIAYLAASCRSTKKIQTAIAKKDTVQVTVISNGKNDSLEFMKNTLQQVEHNKIDFTTFSAKVNVDYRDASNKNYNVNASLRMYRDSAIWISVNALLGIEAMRFLITKDSVKLLNKLEKTYTARSVDYLQEVTSLPLDLKILQDLLIGNPVFLDGNIVSYSRADGTISLLSISSLFKHLITLSEGSKTLLHSKLDDADITRSRTADLTYDDYESRKGVLFSKERRITVAEKKKLDIRMTFRQYDFNEPVSFPFNVPKNFSYF
ncbi:MAG: DUF4292 domain-containing protein [Chitinophagaceae bacterium]|nr:DUF4292 domain-containing protein [Chitinophagaceae bacterium]